MKWFTRESIHIDRAASAWLIKRSIDTDAQFAFISDLSEVSEGGVPFDMRGVDLGHHGHDCTFETLLRRYELIDPVLWKISEIVHEADLDDEHFDAPEAAGLDVVLRGLSMIHDDVQVLAVSGAVFDGLYAYYHRALILGKEPA
ncbi:chromate resistance protein ChrB domain-containing protein [Arthrobacter sp. H5]|uniref:chromate resistance protein ChrB domain-containing protein n=1 Tax=Arthrobacter sp. H5 TaxID=1267973 RepID=UPI000487C84C|nr:chromate resistance protein ChrB domain-containing protein [Arthrobacter sp. H5]